MKEYRHFKPIKVSLLLFIVSGFNNIYAQNSLTGDGFGGRGWYVPHNYSVGSYSGYTVCGANKQLYGWGGNFYGQLGDGTQISTTAPVAATGMTNVKFFTSGYFSGVIKNDNTAWVFGGYNSGFTSTPTQVLTNVKFLNGGASHIVFVKNDGTVWGAGQNVKGQLGNGTTSPSFSPVTVPVQMTGINNAVRAVALNDDSYAATIILLNDSTVKLTGGYQWFSPNDNHIPVTVPGLSKIVDIKGCASVALALNTFGEVYVFGREYSSTPGTLGLGAYTGLYTPPTKLTFPAGAAPIIALSAKNDGFCTFALDETGNVYGWGFNYYGNIGNGANTNIYTPTLIATNVIDIFAGEDFSYILKTDNSLWATGQSLGGSIWMNLPDYVRYSFTQIDPTIAPMNLCAPTVVPIHLLNFNCKATGTAARLSWRSAEEINFSKYLIQYSSDGTAFNEIGSVAAKGSNNSYNFDHQDVSGLAYYRLKMVDDDGRFRYSEIRIVKFPAAIRFTIAPNPANDHITLFTKRDANIKSISIYSLDGRIVKTINYLHSGQKINISDIPNGTYILKTLDYKGEIEYGKFIKL